MLSSLAQELLADFQTALSENVPNARLGALATCGSDGQPRVRTVVIHELAEHSALLVVSRYHQKWKQLVENQKAELMLWWLNLGIQYRLTGQCLELSPEIAKERWLQLPNAVRKLDLAYGDDFIPGAPIRETSDLHELVQSRSRDKDLNKAPLHVRAVSLEFTEIERLKASPSDRLHDRRSAILENDTWRCLQLVP